MFCAARSGLGAGASLAADSQINRKPGDHVSGRWSGKEMREPGYPGVLVPLQHGWTLLQASVGEMMTDGSESDGLSTTGRVQKFLQRVRQAQ